MRKLNTLSTAIALAVMALAATSAQAESTYGYSSNGTGTVTATARINLSVTVPKLILLRVGTATGTGDTLAWTAGVSIPGTPIVPAATANNVAANWDGTLPVFTTGANPAAVSVFAWTNSGTGTINCANAVLSPATGPTAANFTVAVTGTLPHPGANLGACTSTSFASNTLATGTWAYSLGGTPASWVAGAYAATVTYTAQGL